MGASGIVRALLRRLHGPIYDSRLRELVRRIVPHLAEDDRVLDVGCGFGALGRAIMDDPHCPRGVEVEGLESAVRDGAMIPIRSYDGKRMPYEDDAFAVVILADVLHHEADPDGLIRESARVAQRLVIIKDHKLAGFLARPRVSFIDWAANAPYGVPCRYEYNTLAAWRACHERHGLSPEQELTSMRLYPPLVNLLFGRRLQYLAILRVPAGPGGD